MLAKIVIVVLFIAMVISLGVALRHMVKDRGRGDGTVRALTMRVGIWVVLFLFIAIGLYSGFTRQLTSAGRGTSAQRMTIVTLA